MDHGDFPLMSSKPSDRATLTLVFDIMLCQMWTNVRRRAVRASRCALMSQVVTGVPAGKDSPL